MEVMRVHMLSTSTYTGYVVPHIHVVLHGTLRATKYLLIHTVGSWYPVPHIPRYVQYTVGGISYLQQIVGTRAVGVSTVYQDIVCPV